MPARGVGAGIGPQRRGIRRRGSLPGPEVRYEDLLAPERDVGRVAQRVGRLIVGHNFGAVTVRPPNQT